MGRQRLDQRAVRLRELEPQGAASLGERPLAGTCRGVVPANASTILSPPVGSYDPNTGHVAVKVLGGAAEPLPAVPVTLSGPGVNRNLATTTDGCAFFAFLPAATYTVQLAAAGYVDGQGVANPSQVTGVVSEATELGGVRLRPGRALPRPERPPGTAVPSRRSVPIGVGNTARLLPVRSLHPGTGARHHREPVPVRRRVRGVGRRLCGC